MIRRLWHWLRMWPERRRCFHHYIPRVGDEMPRPVESWIRSHLIDLGRRKIWWCSHCEKVWIR